MVKNFVIKGCRVYVSRPRGQSCTVYFPEFQKPEAYGDEAGAACPTSSSTPRRVPASNAKHSARPATIPVKPRRTLGS